MREVEGVRDEEERGKESEGETTFFIALHQNFWERAGGTHTKSHGFISSLNCFGTSSQQMSSLSLRWIMAQFMFPRPIVWLRLASIEAWLFWYESYLCFHVVTL
jgi:hypothetical protein